MFQLNSKTKIFDFLFLFNNFRVYISILKTTPLISDKNPVGQNIFK